jgi:hypothetical protein
MFTAMAPVLQMPVTRVIAPAARMKPAVQNRKRAADPLRGKRVASEKSRV